MSTADDRERLIVVASDVYDPEHAEPVSARIVRLVAVASDRSSTQLKPLGYVIDVDALDMLLGPETFAESAAPIELSFWYEGYRIDIDPDGTVNLLIEKA